MKKYKILVLAHQLKNKVIAKSGAVVSEDQLLENASALEGKGFIRELTAEEYADLDKEPADADKPKGNAKGNGNTKGKVVELPAEKLRNAAKKLTAAIEAREKLGTDAKPDQIAAADGKVKKITDELIALGMKPEEIPAPKIVVADPNADNNNGGGSDENVDLNAELLAGPDGDNVKALLDQYEAAVDAHKALPADANVKVVGNAAAAVEALENQLKERGYQFPVKDEE